MSGRSEDVHREVAVMATGEIYSGHENFMFALGSIGADPLILSVGVNSISVVKVGGARLQDRHIGPQVGTISK